ncbi:hypothetical protein HALLA_15140 [Halostagnicola larsenii XH-48]|uniref:SpoVT-AbrB domain-containing protein n=1 Tax=Halostagnicola larsenii XH-48 TaxID=797299 RepID=W0JMW1_9EURY|nr:hypothetical protein HALLA_15140 [Halostagnicola larsenii XH-48]
MSDISLDDRGRLTLPKEVRERYGDRYHVVQLPEGVKLVPLADDLRNEAREAVVNNLGSGGRDICTSVDSEAVDEA